MHTRTVVRVLLASSIALASAPLAARAQEGMEAAGPRPILEFSCAGLEQVMPDERDEPLRRLLAMLPDRLEKLPGELPEVEDEEIEELLVKIPLLSRIALNPMTFQLGILDDPFAAGDPGRRVALRMTSSAGPGGSPREIEREIVGIVESTRGELDAPDAAGMRQMFTPAGIVRFGVAPMGAQEQLVLAINDEDLPELEPPRGLLPRGVDPVLWARLDVAPLSPFIAMAAQQGPAEIDWLDLLRDLRLIGDDAISADLAWGYSDERAHGTVHIRSLGAALEAIGLEPETVLGPRQLEMIPADVATAYATVYTLDWIVPVIEALARHENEEADPIGAIETLIGIDIGAELIEPLGEWMLAYRATSTGGGITSLVAIVALDDPATFELTLERMRESINLFLRATVRGYVQFRPWTMPGGQVAWCLRFPGLPVPFEPCWTIRDDLLVLAMSPRGLIEALGQIANARSSILDRPDVARVLEAQDDPLIGLEFVDTQRGIEAGYGSVNVMMSALANLVRTPDQPDLAADLIVPSRAALERGAIPMTSYYFRRGDDVVIETEASRSMLSNLAGLLGSSGTSAFAIAQYSALLGAIAPAMGEARQNARRIKSAEQLRGILVATESYRLDFGRLPASLDVLVDEGYLTAGQMESPSEPAPDGGDDYAVLLGAARDPARGAATPVAIDRAAYLNGEERVGVGFADGHVEMVEWEGIEEIFDPEDLEALGL